VVVLDGNTGTAKTDLLPLLAAQGVQVLDLEALANHRGSLFGAMAGGQPAQKMFETRLAMALERLEPGRLLVVEGESSKIGNLVVPPKLWEAMKSAPRLEGKAPGEERAAYLARRYDDVIADGARLRDTRLALAPLHPRERIEDWLTLAQSGAYAELAGDLMQAHYDPRYEKQRSRFDDLPHRSVTLPRLSPEGLAQAAPELAKAARALSAG